ncbi:hypothetical protein K6T82_11320 [Flavobacterium sp. 17A]|uniref:Uncharacterized protein n=1 Tax=Flavobacterium potami TaxID=2872310 RepID=A0A9X1H9T5_9FLAO|nr:hypothetical protein [Flavobacterium potami]MBZ4035358.1 hypothetical protein [Flavobacterium potami]
MKKKAIFTKVCVYLDQFAVSDMVDNQQTELWSEIKNQLIKLHQDGIIFCPKSSEHYFETSQKSHENSVLHDSFLERLSDGWCFKPELFVSSQLISSHIRKNTIGIKTYMYDNVQNILESDIKYSQFNELSTNFRGLVLEATEGINDLRKYTRDIRMDSKTKKSFLKVLEMYEPRNFISRLQDLYNEGGIRIRGVSIGGQEIPHWIDLIIDQLLRTHKFTRLEVKKLITEFEQNGFKNIPSLNIRFSLHNLAAVYQKKETPGDHMDFARLSTGMPLSTLLFTDKKRKNELLELGFDTLYGTKIFSGAQPDLVDFLSELKTL